MGVSQAAQLRDAKMRHQILIEIVVLLFSAAIGPGLAQNLDGCSINVCDHTCTSITGGHICSCMSGYYLDPDGFQCIPENSSPPSLSESMSIFHVVENNSTAFVGQVTASDSDGDDITFHLAGSDSYNFNIDSNGVITTTAALDYEAQDQYRVVVFARDDGVPAMSSSALITIFIDNVNEAPQFSQSSYSFAVPEDLSLGTSVGMVFATDLESVVCFAIAVESQDIHIDGNTGELFASSLDYEFQNFYSIMVQACDVDSLCTTATVLIEVLDVDDNPIQFDYNYYGATIYHDTPVNSVLFQAVTVDIDTGAFFYDINNTHSGLFNISSTGLVTLEQDLQQATCGVHYVFDIYAINNLVNATSTMDFFVPCFNFGFSRFNSTHYAFTIFENSNDFEATLGLTAGIEDEDIIIEIVEGLLPHPFQLNGLTLCLKPDSQLDDLGLSDPSQPGLDREIYDSYTVVIEASSQSVMSTTTVTLTVLDVNDSPPVFPFPVYNLQLDESTPPSSVAAVLILEAQDNDTGSISYQLTTGGEAGVFSINASSGELFLVNTLDREVQSEYSLTICAYDGVNQSCTSVDVTVSDNELVFPLDDITISIPENTLPETLVLTVMAIDADPSTIENIEYFLSESSDFFIETIANAGVLFTAGELDFASTTEYNLVILAVDHHQRFAVTQVTIYVENSNDGLPQFPNNEYNVSISESEPIGFIVLNFTATDNDGLPLESEFSIIVVDQGIFTVTNSSMEAVILLESSLDREERDMYVLGLRAQEVNDPTRYFAVPVYITILDSNDNAPVFTNLPSNIPIGENVVPGYVLTIVSAVDADIGSNKAIFFSVVDTNGSFAINETTGDLFVTETQNIEILNEYFVTIQANDRTSSPRTSQSVVIVTVTNSVFCSCIQPDYIRQIAACTTVQGSDCQCIQQNCMCPGPYVGDGSLCSMDTDGDGFPDIPLPSCTEELSNLDYCRTDNCPAIANPDLQDATTCVFCLPEIDMEWNLPWNLAASDSTITNQCPNNGEGIATRYCYPHGVWDPVNVVNCTSMGFNFLRQQAEILNETSTASNQEKLGRVESIIVALLNTTGPTSNTRLFPQDLVTTTKLLNSIVDFYAVTLEEITNTGCIENLIDVINNVLNQIYVDEWQELEAVSERQILLSNIEQFGRLIANATVQIVDRNQTSLVRSNIVLNARVLDLNDEQDIVFPATGSPFSTEPQFDFSRAQISIPPSVISESQPAIAHFFIGVLASLAHGVSGNLYVDDRQTLTIENFDYDGFANAAIPYHYERGVDPFSSEGGSIIPVSTQSDAFNRAYSSETVVLSVPAGVTICDIGYFTVRERDSNLTLTTVEFPEILPGCRVSLVTTVMNIQDILPAFENNGGRNIRTVAASMALSTQIGNGSSLTLNTPVQLGFTTEAIEGGFNPRCVFWDFSQEAWSTSGVQTSSVATQIDREFNTFSVVCETNHFTTFVVLVDVTEAFCSCVPMPIGGMVFPTCGDAGTDACQCTETGCTCQLPFIGDGEACTLDRDSDGIPDRPLPTCTEQQENQNFCKEDNCTFDFNPDQDSRACEAIVEEGFDGCPAEVDEVWNIQWNDTFSGVYDTQPCPEDRIGLAIRLCNTDRDWESVNVLACQSQEFTELSQEIEDVLDETSGQTTAETTEAVAMITEELADATNTIDETTPLYPQEITITTDIVDDVVTFLLNTVDEPATESDTALQLNSELIQVFDNILDESNADSWMQLEDAEDTGSETLLMNAEEYGLYVASALASNTTDTGNSSEIPLSGSFGNIVLEATLQETDELNDVFFPVREETFTTEPQFQERLAQIKIPAQLLRERADQDDATRVSTINIVMMNIQEFLPNNFIEAQISQSNDSNTTVTTVPATMVLSSQIATDTSSIPQTLNTTAQLVFTTNAIRRGFNPRCAFWNFTEGAWDTSGVDTVSVRNQSENNSNTFHVVCETQHLTSFCVLVDTTGEILDGVEAFALELISFIGCGVSMFFLLLAILFFLSYGKQLFTSVHYFIHLNLAIALFLGYLTFVSGIETAVNSKIACKFVSALLHYLFLSVFCWMLCEGIMIYLLLVVVFSKISKQWWIFFLIGWGIPLVIVSIAVGIAHKQYAPEGQEYCWISVEKGAIWAFVGPMLAVICINIIFWILALRNLYKVQATKREQHVNKTQTFLARKLMLAALTLLPLLGLTWIFGLLSVNSSTTVFSWLFTILNSTQGVFIFIFHVLRTDKVQKKLEKWIPCLKKSKLDRTKSQVSKSTSGYQRRRVKTKKQNYSDSSALCSDAVIVFEDPDIALSIISGKRRKGSDEIGLTTRTWIA